MFVVSPGDPVASLPPLPPEEIQIRLEAIHRAALEEIVAYNGPYSPKPKPPRHCHTHYDAPAQVERWRSLVAAHFDHCRVDWALRIIECESRGDPTAKNRRSSARGLFQFLRGTWNAVAKHTGSPTYGQGGPNSPRWSVINAAWLLENAGPRQWSCRARR